MLHNTPQSVYSTNGRFVCVNNNSTNGGFYHFRFVVCVNTVLSPTENC